VTLSDRPCPHGMPKPSTCVDCMDEGPVVPPVRWQPVGQPFMSLYGGVCPTCGDSIEAGVDFIERWDFGDDRTVYTHDRCGQPARRH
jgi:hypothetical protein